MHLTSFKYMLRRCYAFFFDATTTRIHYNVSDLVNSSIVCLLDCVKLFIVAFDSKFSWYRIVFRRGPTRSRPRVSVFEGLIQDDKRTKVKMVFSERDILAVLDFEILSSSSIL